jgi:hypothetical protein
MTPLPFDPASAPRPGSGALQHAALAVLGVFVGCGGSAALPTKATFDAPAAPDTADADTAATADLDGDGYTTADGDCDDTDASVHPGASETWYDGVDQDCAGDNDDDADGDGYAGTSAGGTDCDDTNSAVHPDGIDTPLADGDCDGSFSNSLAGAPLRFAAEAAGDWAGVSLATTGDVDADGVPDMVVGARYNSTFGERTGKVYLLSGAHLDRSDHLGDHPAFHGEADNNWLGYAVGRAGDVTGDGIPDLLLGALQHDEARGAVYVVPGGGWLQEAGTDLNVADHATTTLVGALPDDLLGISIYTAGDVDGDDRADLLVGAHHATTAGGVTGEAFLLRGGGLLDGSQPRPDVEDAAWTFIGEHDGDEAGRFVTGIDDYDGDGLDDVAIAAPWADHAGAEDGIVYVVSSASLPVYSGTPQILSLADADLRLHGEAAGDSAGHSILTAGDLDGDGRGDLAVGSMFNDAGGTDAGRAYFIVGDTLAHHSPVFDLADADHKLAGESTDDRAGRLASSAGDLDGDGRDDLLMSAFERDEGGENTGKTYLFLASSLGLSSTASMADADATLLGVHEGDYAGQTAAGVGDLDGDGRGELLIGAYREDTSGEDAGMVYVLWSNL